MRVSVAGISRKILTFSEMGAILGLVHWGGNRRVNNDLNAANACAPSVMSVWWPKQPYRDAWEHGAGRGGGDGLGQRLDCGGGNFSRKKITRRRSEVFFFFSEVIV